LAAVSYVDAQIGRLLARLNDLGIADKTIVVLWGDNGYKLGDHGSWCKMTNFETDTHVPLIIKAPGCMGRRKQIVEFVDIYPTLCELAAVPVPDCLAGTSLMPLLRNDASPRRVGAYSQYLRSGIWQDPDGRDYMGYTIRTEAFRYVEWFDWESGAYAARELYDHRKSSDECANVAERPEFQNVVDDLAAALRKTFCIR
jgi:arylsulfatase A-like enzyme